MALLTSFEPSKPAAPAPNPLKVVKTVAVLRIGTGLILLIYFALPAALQGYQFVWNRVPWAWVDLLKENGFPAPHILAPIAGGLTILACVGWLLGFFTRLFGITFLPVVIGAIVIAEKMDAKPYQPFCYILLFATITLILCGSGHISVDQLFKLVDRPKKKKKRGMFDGP